MRKFFIFILFILALSPLSTLAGEFSPDYIISDYDLTNVKTMSLPDVIEFLKLQDGALANYFSRDLDNKVKHAGEIIYNASQRHSINPQILLTLIQKEQTLITQPAVKNTQFDWATGFACYDNQKPVSRFSGFTVQVDKSAWRLRYFLEHPWEFYYRPNQAYIIGGRKVMLQNLATAALYNYTPHLTGNKLFWAIWQKWFAQKGAIPNGTLVQAINDKGIWLVQNGKRRPFYSRSVFLASYKFKDVKRVPLKTLKQLEVGEPVSFPNYSLLKASSGDIFLLVDDIKRRISSPKVFQEIGFNPEEVVNVDNVDLQQYPEGKPITTPYPTGALLEDQDSGGLFYVQDDIKYPVLDRTILEINFPYNRIVETNHDKLEKLTTGVPIKFNDGVLIKAPNQSTVYVVAQGKRLPIANVETFEALGYQWENILTVSELTLNVHPLGEILDVNKM